MPKKATTAAKKKSKSRGKRGKYGTNYAGKKTNEAIFEFQLEYLAANHDIPKIVEIAEALKIDRSTVSRRMKTIKREIPREEKGQIIAALPAILKHTVRAILKSESQPNPKLLEFLFRVCGIEFDPERLDVGLTGMKVKFVNDEYREPDDVQDSDSDRDT